MVKVCIEDGKVQGSNLGHVIPKASQMVLVAASYSAQQSWDVAPGVFGMLL